MTQAQIIEDEIPQAQVAVLSGTDTCGGSQPWYPHDDRSGF